MFGLLIYSGKYDKTEKKSSTKCGTNQELGADGVTCVCKSGYKKINGVCSKEESTTTQTKKTCTIPNRIQNADGSCSSECESGYELQSDGTCKVKEETTTEPSTDPDKPDLPDELMP